MAQDRDLGAGRLEVALTTDAGDNVYPGEKIHLKLSIKNTGNNGYTGLTATLSDGTDVWRFASRRREFRAHRVGARAERRGHCSGGRHERQRRGGLRRPWEELTITTQGREPGVVPT